MSRKALNLIYAWLDDNKYDLMENWERIEDRKPLKKLNLYKNDKRYITNKSLSSRINLWPPNKINFF